MSLSFNTQSIDLVQIFKLTCISEYSNFDRRSLITENDNQKVALKGVQFHLSYHEVIYCDSARIFLSMCHFAICKAHQNMNSER